MDDVEPAFRFGRVDSSGGRFLRRFVVNDRALNGALGEDSKTIGDRPVPAVINGREFGQAIADRVVEHLLAITPSPIPLGATGDVHAGLAAETQNVLKRHDRCVGDRAERKRIMSQ